MMNYYEAIGRIGKLEAALQEIIDLGFFDSDKSVQIARAALFIVAVAEADDDGQPSEAQEWRDYDEAC